MKVTFEIEIEADPVEKLSEEKKEFFRQAFGVECLTEEMIYERVKHFDEDLVYSLKDYYGGWKGWEVITTEITEKK